MTIKTISDKNPTANLAINRSRIKKYGKNKSIPSYYLEKGQEFQIELYNPTQEKVLTTIKLNNKPISGGLVLRPGERVFLDRFLDTNKKFLFDTYKVDNTKSSRKAIEPNGDVEIAFFKEIQIQPFMSYASGTVTLDWTDNSTGNIGNSFITTNGNVGIGTTTDLKNVLSTNTGGVTFSGPAVTNSVNCSYNLSDVGQDFYIPVRGVLKGSTLAKALKSRARSVTPTKIETGRVEQGSKSDQSLCEATGEFETSSFHVVRYKLLPKSQEKLSTKDYYTKYCSDCGAKSKTKFCPYCGAKQ